MEILASYKLKLFLQGHALSDGSMVFSVRIVSDDDGTQTTFHMADLVAADNLYTVFYRGIISTEIHSITTC